MDNKVQLACDLRNYPRLFYLNFLLHVCLFWCVFSGHHVMAAPAPHAGVALVTALNILEGFNISSHMSRNSTYHWIAEVLHKLTEASLTNLVTN